MADYRITDRGELVVSFHENRSSINLGNAASLIGNVTSTSFHTYNIDSIIDDQYPSLRHGVSTMVSLGFGKANITLDDVALALSQP